MKSNSIIKYLLLIAIISFFGIGTTNAQKGHAKPEDKGIGPVKEVKLGAIDKKLVDKGSSIYNDKCSACHNIDDVNLAPPLRGVSKRLSPVFIMNYLVNTTEMQKKDPAVISLIQQWKKVPMMKDQHLKQNDARAVLEFLRSLDK
ncbi:MAG: c-type cytochrome [Ignavibacteriaceae bacterium]